MISSLTLPTCVCVCVFSPQAQQSKTGEETRAAEELLFINKPLTDLTSLLINMVRWVCVCVRAHAPVVTVRVRAYIIKCSSVWVGFKPEAQYYFIIICSFHVWLSVFVS